MIIVTGAAGFIASALVARLNELRYFDLVLVDDFSREERTPNYQQKKYRCLLDRKELFSFIEQNENQIDFIFHLGARTDTTEFNKAIFDELNVEYTQMIWNFCCLELMRSICHPIGIRLIGRHLWKWRIRIH